MKTLAKLKFVFLGLLLLIVAPKFIHAQTTAEVSSEVRADIEKQNKTMESAIKANDMSKVVDLYTDEATIIVAGQKLQGRKAIADYWYNFSRCKDFKIEITGLGGSGKVIYQLSKWTMTLQKDGKEVTSTSDVVMVWKRQTDWTYKIQLNSNNSQVTDAL